jgi:hypothetical protein
MWVVAGVHRPSAVLQQSSSRVLRFISRENRSTGWQPRRIGPGSQISSHGFARRCSSWNPFRNFEKRQNAANSCVFSHLQQASQASDVGSIWFFDSFAIPVFRARDAGKPRGDACSSCRPQDRGGYLVEGFATRVRYHITRRILDGRGPGRLLVAHARHGNAGNLRSQPEGPSERPET